MSFSYAFKAQSLDNESPDICIEGSERRAATDARSSDVSSKISKVIADAHHKFAIEGLQAFSHNESFVFVIPCNELDVLGRKTSVLILGETVEEVDANDESEKESDETLKHKFTGMLEIFIDLSGRTFDDHLVMKAFEQLNSDRKKNRRQARKNEKIKGGLAVGLVFLGLLAITARVIEKKTPANEHRVNSDLSSPALTTSNSSSQPPWRAWFTHGFEVPLKPYDGIK